MAKHVINSTQTVHPWRAALRTGTNTALSVLTLLVVALPLVSDFIEEFWPGSPAVAWIASAVLFAGALATLINRLILLPAFNEFLTRIGLGPAPKDEFAVTVEVVDPRENGLGGIAPPID